MKKLTKRLSVGKKQLLKDSYDMPSAIKIGRDLATAKFNESMEAHICLNLDPKQAKVNQKSCFSLLNFKVSPLSARRFPPLLHIWENYLSEFMLFKVPFFEATESFSWWNISKQLDLLRF